MTGGVVISGVARVQKRLDRPGSPRLACIGSLASAPGLWASRRGTARAIYGGGWFEGFAAGYCLLSPKREREQEWKTMT